MKEIKPKVTLVGAGPGDPDLITLKGIRAIASADVILYDALVNDSLLEYASEDCTKIYVGKRAERLSTSQDHINQLLVDYALTHGHVVRLKGGDPFVFGQASIACCCGDGSVCDHDGSSTSAPGSTIGLCSCGSSRSVGGAMASSSASERAARDRPGPGAAPCCAGRPRGCPQPCVVTMRMAAGKTSAGRRNITAIVRARFRAIC